LLLPSLNGAKESARRIACLGNCRQIVAATLSYADESKNYLPNASAHLVSNDAHWCNAIASQCSYSTAIFACPSDKTAWFTRVYKVNQTLYGKPCYGMNVYLWMRPPLSLAAGVFSDGSGVPVHLKLSQISNPSRCVVYADSDNPSGGVNPQFLYPYSGGGASYGGGLSIRHKLGGNYAFSDGHCDWALMTKMAYKNEYFGPLGN